MKLTDLQDMEIGYFKELEARLFMSGDHQSAELVAYVIELKNEVEELEDKIEKIEKLAQQKTLALWEDEYGSASAYRDFFHSCFDYLPWRYPGPKVTSERDKSVIFEAVRGHPWRGAEVITV